MSLPASQPARVLRAVGEADAHHVQLGPVERVDQLVDAQHALLGSRQRLTGPDLGPIEDSGFNST